MWYSPVSMYLSSQLYQFGKRVSRQIDRVVRRSMLVFPFIDNQLSINIQAKEAMLRLSRRVIKKTAKQNVDISPIYCYA